MDVIGRARGTDEPSTEAADPAHAATGAVPAEPRAD
jgi:NCS2 family nucleobase:cation symporter-2